MAATFSRDTCYGTVQNYTCNACFMGGIPDPHAHVCRKATPTTAKGEQTMQPVIVKANGESRNVKNLGWLLRHAGEVNRLVAWTNGHGRYLEAFTEDGTHFMAAFGSWDILINFTRRRVFAHAAIQIQPQ